MAAIKGRFWKDREVEALLDLLLESGKAARIMCSSHLPTKSLFSRVARQLGARGYPRSADQCRSKFKRIKADFFGALEHWQGIPRMTARPPYFAQMRRLWEQAGRPSWEDRRHAAVQRGIERARPQVREEEEEEEVEEARPAPEELPPPAVEEQEEGVPEGLEAPPEPPAEQPQDAGMGRDLAIREAALGEDPGGRRGPQQSRLRRPVVEAPPEPPAEQPQDAGMGRDLAIREAALGEDPGGRRGPQQSRLRRPVVEAPPEPPAEQPQVSSVGEAPPTSAPHEGPSTSSMSGPPASNPQGTDNVLNAIEALEGRIMNTLNNVQSRLDTVERLLLYQGRKHRALERRVRALEQQLSAQQSTAREQ
ncbi:uncharacterized protein LOC129336509 [Eublepharis macularius]|uniref:Uncharacterized protein LOC129323573 n=1 Tax=Eublepharis macularius TaxID=481883 RepID=A0AA97JSS3_EUBMA|nr:uncharacterized protein LOC129323573 [Eublepharis macularius]XP_054842637.1 uncharacterized protein LOC129334510 [Eublepharis macularius]XP_054845613.1 uncharacterized protein LOC129336509 [Eublepharis macularius]